MDHRLGLTARDRITGFEGVVVGHCSYLTGCSQLLLVPKAKDGALVSSEWFDEQRIEILPGTPVVLDNGDTPGCDRPAPRR